MTSLHGSAFPSGHLLSVPLKAMKALAETARLICLTFFFFALVSTSFAAGSGGNEKPQLLDAAVARIDMQLGQVFRQPKALGAWSRVAAGEPLSEGDALLTGPDGYAYIVTADRAFISVRPNSELVIERYAVSQDENAGGTTQIRFNLKRGVARFISGEAVSKAKDRFRLNTPIAAIGVRGTDFTVFTSDSVTRATVTSGAIAVAPLGGLCSLAGLGPCVGPSTVDLGVGGAFPVIELGRGDQRPRLVPSTKLSPDAIAPPGPGERERLSSGSEDHSEGGVRSLETGSLTGGGASAPVISSLLESESDARVVDPRRLPAPALEWGRWKPLADLGPEDAKQLFSSGPTELMSSLGSYILRRERLPAYDLPKNGRYGFVLRDYEAFFVADGAKASPVGIQNPELVIDFSLSRFTTRLDLQTTSGVVGFQSSGRVFASGRLLNDKTEQPQTLLNGTLAGPSASQAGYLFETQLPFAQGTISGATRWTR